jgi:hypothetical protein
MTIHHATLKRAAKLDISLVETDVDGFAGARATWTKYGFVHKDPKTALAAAALQKMLRSEYPALSLSQDGDDFVVTANDEDQEVYRGDSVPELADVLEAAEAMDINPETGESEEEEHDLGSVVALTYKKKYREAGHPDNCGDWLAETLDGVFLNGEGVFDDEAFTQFLKDNGVVFEGKWASLPTSGQKGWKGRYRMNGRQRLERRLAVAGALVLGGKKIKLPDGFAKYLAKKYPEAVKERSDAKSQ